MEANLIYSKTRTKWLTPCQLCCSREISIYWCLYNISILITSTQILVVSWFWFSIIISVNNYFCSKICISSRLHDNFLSFSSKIRIFASCTATCYIINPIYPDFKYKTESDVNFYNGNACKVTSPIVSRSIKKLFTESPFFLKRGPKIVNWKLVLVVSVKIKQKIEIPALKYYFLEFPEKEVVFSGHTVTPKLGNPI